MDDQVAFVQLAEINLGAMTFGMPQAAPRVRGEAAEQFRGGKNNQLRGGKTESAGERAENKIDILQHARIDDFAEAFDLAFRLKINNDARFACAPIVQAIDELVALRFREHEIAHRELADATILKRAAKIFCATLDPAFADLNLRLRTFFRFDVDLQMIAVDVIADEPTLIVGRAEQDIDCVQIAHRSLSVDVELEQRFNLVAKKFEAHRQRRLPRVNIDNSAANGELSAGGDLGDALITGIRKFFEDAFHRYGTCPFKLK